MRCLICRHDALSNGSSTSAAKIESIEVIEIKRNKGLFILRMQSVLIFDIETGPLADEQLERVFTFTPPDPPAAEFDASSVKYGNLKDEAKRATKLEEARAAHAASLNDWPTTLAALREAEWQKFKDKAALSAMTGKVLAIGVINGEGKTAILHGDGSEEKLLTDFWELCKKKRGKDRFAGMNIYGFDLPFLIIRSWILGVSIPNYVYTPSGKWTNFDQSFVDLRCVWLLGRSWGEAESNLNAVSLALGGKGKMQDVGGGDFARLWFGTEEEHELAVSYLINDLVETKFVANKLGFV